MNDYVPSSYVQKLIVFHDRFDHVLNARPQIPPAATKNLRKRLIQEEVKELFTAIDNDDMVEVADGIADLLYVTFGCAVSYGIPIDSVFGEVHLSNMTKSGERDEHGKTIKGKNFYPPQIKDILKRHGWEG